MRRTSWLNEIPSSTRKSSVTTNTPYSPTTSHPATPSGDSTTWGTAGSPGLGAAGAWSSSATTYPWGGIWNTEGRKDPPSRLQEVLPSPTAINAPVARFLSENSPYTTINRASVGDPAIPFSIPLHPTPKTYRSQSYSVGQLDPESFKLASPAMTDLYTASKGRGNGQYHGLVRRSSRPSGLGDRGHDTGGLGRVREDEDDEEHDSQHKPAQNDEQARKIEQLIKENTWLRQKEQEHQTRNRTMSSHSAASRPITLESPLENPRMRAGFYEDSDLAVDEIDDGQYESIENRNIENVKRTHWHTSLGFETVLDPPQSRRHSFADVPTRHDSISSTNETISGTTVYDTQNGRQTREESYGTFGEDTQDISRGQYRKSPQIPFRRLEEQQLELEHLRIRQFAAQYFAGSESTRRPAEEPRRAPNQVYVAPEAYGRHIGFGTQQGQHVQPLYMVSFKCRRSDVFYIQEGTGLHVEPGDLVIVEADRGTDLGTVLDAKISWDDARVKKEQYAEEHYKWLMMFSRQSQTGGPNAVNPNGLSGLNGAPGSAVGGMGPPGHHAPQEPQSGELKPKLIKRLAQSHEIQTLKDKEGNEAKAKRMCQQKVVEHRLTMEILDAEFQM